MYKDILVDCTTSIPYRKNSKPIRLAANQWISDTLSSRLKQCESVLNIDISDLISSVEKIKIDEKWAPEIFLAVHFLAASMKSGNVTRILDSIQEIINIVKSGIISSNSSKVSSVLSDLWEPKYIALLRKYNQKNIRGEGTIVRPIVENSKLNFHMENIQKSIELIKLHDDDQYSEIEELVTDIKLFQGRVLRGDTSTYTFGSMWLRVPEPEDDQIGYWIEHIIHETSHLRLVVHFFYEKLVLNPMSETIFNAPIRDDPRPMYGIFHACFVLARMMRIFRRLSISGYDKRFRDRLQLFRLQFEKGLVSVSHPEAQFSENGKIIRESFQACASDT